LKGGDVLYWAAIFFALALVAGLLGFGGIAGAATVVAEILFFVFLVALVISLAMGLSRRTPT